MLQIVGQEVPQQGGGCGLVPLRSGGLEAPLQQRDRAAADQVARGVQRQRRQFVLGQQAVQRADQVGRGLHQGAVQVEGDGPAFQIAHRHALSLPHAALMG